MNQPECRYLLIDGEPTLIGAGRDLFYITVAELRRLQAEGRAEPAPRSGLTPEDCLNPSGKWRFRLPFADEARTRYPDRDPHRCLAPPLPGMDRAQWEALLRHQNIVASTAAPDRLEYALYGMPCPLSRETHRPRLVPGAVPEPRLLAVAEMTAPEGKTCPVFACPVCGAKLLLEEGEEVRLVRRAVRDLIRRKFGPEPVDAAALSARERAEYADLRYLAEHIRGAEIHG